MKNISKNPVIFAVFFLVLFFSMAGGVNNANAADTSCAQPCQAPLVCSNGACIAPSHTVPAVGSSGQITSTRIPGVTEGTSDIIKCGRPGQDMCTLCDMISGMNNIIQYLMKISIGVALLAFSIGGVMYVVSAGDTGQINTAKSVMKNAAIGFVVIFAGWLIINTTIDYLGARKNKNGEITFGMNIISWGKFDCSAQQR